MPDCELLRRAIVDFKRHQSELRRSRRLSRKMVMSDVAWILHAVETIKRPEKGIGRSPGRTPGPISRQDADLEAPSLVEGGFLPS